MPQKQITVTATIARNYGPLVVTYTASETIMAEKYGEVMKSHQALTSAIFLSFQDYDSHQIQKMPVAPARGIEADTKPKAPQWYVAKEMYMSVNDGKKYYFVRTTNNPKTNKFGAAVYWDRFTGMTLEDFKQQSDDDTMKIVFTEGMRVLIEEFKGKPRAIQIAHKDAIGEG